MSQVFLVLFQMKSMKAWLALEENKEMIPLNDLKQVLSELSNHEISIKVSNVGPISYDMLAGVILIE